MSGQMELENGLAAGEWKEEEQDKESTWKAGARDMDVSNPVCFFFGHILNNVYPQINSQFVRPELALRQQLQGWGLKGN